MSTRTCSRDGCTSPVVGRKLCRKHYQAAWKAGKFENAPLPARQAGRTICPEDHKHADSSTCYIQHQCRCVPCKEHHSAMERNRSRQRAYGRFDTGLVDAEPAREHMMLLAEFGIGYKRAAGLAGVGITAARTLIWGRQDPGPRNGELQKRVKRTTAEKILAVRPNIDMLAGGASIPARGTHRRAQALVTMGWSQSEIARHIGMNVSNFGGMLKRSSVSVSTHRTMAAVFDELWDQKPPITDRWALTSYNRSIGYAKAHRWLPPLAWDDIDNDVEPPVMDVVGGIDEMAVDLAMHGEQVRLTSEERREAVTRLHAMKWSDVRIAETLHIADRTVFRIRQELGLEAFPYEDLRQRGAA